MKKKLTITVLVDHPNSWIIPYALKLIRELKIRKHQVFFAKRYEDIKSGDIAFFLGCLKIVPKNVLALNQHNLVVHESNLPKGKGFSPLSWQILEGKNVIPVALFEADEGVDSGSVYYRDQITFKGHELVDELRHAQG